MSILVTIAPKSYEQKLYVFVLTMSTVTMWPLLFERSVQFFRSLLTMVSSGLAYWTCRKSCRKMSRLQALFILSVVLNGLLGCAITKLLDIGPIEIQYTYRGKNYMVTHDVSHLMLLSFHIAMGNLYAYSKMLVNFLTELCIFRKVNRRI